MTTNQDALLPCKLTPVMEEAGIDASSDHFIMDSITVEGLHKFYEAAVSAHLRTRPTSGEAEYHAGEWQSYPSGEAEPVAAWHDANELAPEGIPVIAEHNAWNMPEGELMQHVVWNYGGEWRRYPDTEGRAYVNRWRNFPHTTQPDARADAELVEQLLVEAFVYCDGTDDDAVQFRARLRTALDTLREVKG